MIYQIRVAPHSSKAHLAAQRAAKLNKEPKTHFKGILVNNQTELVAVTSYQLKGEVTVALATVDDTKLSKEETEGISKAFFNKFLK